MNNSEGLHWIKPSWLRREFVLADGLKVIARLDFEGWGSSCATIRSGDGAWRIAREGFWRSHVSMSGGGVALSARVTWSGNYELEAPFDGALRWGCLSMWKQQYAWTRRDGTPLIVYRPTTAFSQRVYAVDLPGELPLNESRLLLIVLGGYFLQRTHEEMAATVTALSA